MVFNDELLTLIPAPKEISLKEKDDGYVAYELDPFIKSESTEFEEYISSFKLAAKKVFAKNFEAASGGIVLKNDSKLAPSEYVIKCKSNGVFLYASDSDGITNALATLIQVIQAKDGLLYVPAYEIKDRPDAGYRALLVDLARQWHPFNTLMDYIDICYLYKIKYIHFHFTDDQSFTLPFDAFPNASTPGRHYTKRQIEKLNEYAKQRNIEIIPEVELPGHASSLVSAYPELFANKNMNHGINKINVICPGKEGIYDTLSTMIDELIDMFPNSRYIHIGGDEAQIAAWETCPDCISYMNKNSINGKYPLYTRFIKNVTDMVLAKGKTPIVWEGFPKEGNEEISRDVIVTAWESWYHLAPDLIDEGFTITNSSWEPLYIVPAGHKFVKDGRWYPEDILNWTPYIWKNWNKKTAAYEKPIVVEPTDQVIGGTLCAWECNYEQDIQPVKENLAALSERLWNVNAMVDNEEFMKSLDNLLRIVNKVIQ